MRTRPGFVVSSGGHFALDLGLDRENPAACLDALTDGVEQRIDLGIIGDRTFVNNASFGAYAEVVRSPVSRSRSTCRMQPSNSTERDLWPCLISLSSMLIRRSRATPRRSAGAPPDRSMSWSRTRRAVATAVSAAYPAMNAAT